MQTVLSVLYRHGAGCEVGGQAITRSCVRWNLLSDHERDLPSSPPTVSNPPFRSFTPCWIMDPPLPSLVLFSASPGFRGEVGTPGSFPHLFCSLLSQAPICTGGAPPVMIGEVSGALCWWLQTHNMEMSVPLGPNVQTKPNTIYSTCYHLSQPLQKWNGMFLLCDSELVRRGVGLNMWASLPRQPYVLAA